MSGSDTTKQSGRKTKRAIALRGLATENAERHDVAVVSGNVGRVLPGALDYGVVESPTAPMAGSRSGKVLFNMVRTIRTGTLVERVNQERQGVDAHQVDGLRRTMGYPIRRFAGVLGIPEATYKKKVSNNEPFTGSAGYSVLDVADILATAHDLLPPGAEAFDVEAWFGTWISQPQPALGGARPEEYLDTPSGRDIVHKLVGALGSGSYL